MSAAVTNAFREDGNPGGIYLAHKPAPGVPQQLRNALVESCSAGYGGADGGLTGLFAGVAEGRGGRTAVQTDGDGIRVLVDGYLFDPVDGCPPGCAPERPAEMVAALYRRHGMGVTGMLRGSYNCVVIDAGAKRAWLFNDRLGSRPLYVATCPDGTRVAAPAIRTLATLPGVETTLNRQGVAEFLVSAGYYAGHTLFEEIRLFPQAGLLELNENEQQLSRYWSLRFTPPAVPRAASSLMEECDALVTQAVRRCLRVTKNPVLALSGGVDSRVLLTYLRRSGRDDIPLVSYGLAARQGNDMEAARGISRQLGLPLREFMLDLADLRLHAEEALRRIDGRVDILDAPGLYQLWDALATDHDAMFQGDQCFGWHHDLHRPADALAVFRRQNLDVTPRAAAWIDPTARREIRAGIAKTMAQMLAESGHTAANDIKDMIFYEEAIGKIQNAFAAARRQSIEQLRPLLDADVMEFVAKLPADQRLDKRLLRELLARHSIVRETPLAEVHALPLPVDILDQDDALRTCVLGYFREVLGDGLRPELAAWIDLPAVLAVLDALAQRRPLPPLRGPWWRNLPIVRRWTARHAAQAPHPLLSVRRLVVVEQYLRSLGRT